LPCPLVVRRARRQTVGSPTSPRSTTTATTTTTMTLRRCRPSFRFLRRRRRSQRLHFRRGQRRGRRQLMRSCSSCSWQQWSRPPRQRPRQTGSAERCSPSPRCRHRLDDDSGRRCSASCRGYWRQQCWSRPRTDSCRYWGLACCSSSSWRALGFGNSTTWAAGVAQPSASPSVLSGGGGGAVGSCASVAADGDAASDAAALAWKADASASAQVMHAAAVALSCLAAIAAGSG
jgi:hypothetical protein